jgi:hypothetical protein
LKRYSHLRQTGDNSAAGNGQSRHDNLSPGERFFQRMVNVERSRGKAML